MWKILFFPIFLFATDYYLSFQFVTHDYKLFSYKIEYSKALTNPKLKTIKTIIYYPKHKTLKNIFKYEADNIVDLLSKNGVIIYNNDEVNNFMIKNRTKLSFPPKRFNIILKDGIMIMQEKQE
jgi:hypothetical protein